MDEEGDIKHNQRLEEMSNLDFSLTRQHMGVGG